MKIWSSRRLKVKTIETPMARHLYKWHNAILLQNKYTKIYAYKYRWIVKPIYCNYYFCLLFRVQPDCSRLVGWWWTRLMHTDFAFNLRSIHTYTQMKILVSVGFHSGDSNLLIRNAIFLIFVVGVVGCFYFFLLLFALFDQNTYMFSIVFFLLLLFRFVWFFRFFNFIFLFCWLSQIELLLSVYWRTA